MNILFVFKIGQTISNMIIYDTPIEVTKAQYDKICIEFAGSIAHRLSNGHYYVKLWNMSRKDDLQQLINF